jgi:hypothetical protein
MAIQIFQNTAAGLTQANAVADPKHIWIDQPRRIVVFTGDDLPITILAEDAVLTRNQFFQGALLAGGQLLLNKFMNYIYTTMPATGTPTQRNFWREAQFFTYTIPFINQLRTAEAISVADMKQVFILGSGYTP